MAASESLFQVVSISHGGNNLDMPIGGGLNQIVQFLPITFADNTFAQALPIQSRSVEGRSVSLQHASELVIGAKGTLLFTLKKSGGGNSTVSITNMKVGPVDQDFDNPPYTKTISYTSEGDPVVTISI